MRMGVCGSNSAHVQGDLQGATSIGAGVGSANGRWTDGLQVMAGTLPGTLFHIVCKCDPWIALRVHFVVGLGATIIGGASVMHWGVGNLSWWVLGNLCSTFCSGWVMIGTLCRLPGGKSHSWVGHVSVFLLRAESQVLNVKPYSINHSLPIILSRQYFSFFSVKGQSNRTRAMWIQELLLLIQRSTLSDQARPGCHDSLLPHVEAIQVSSDLIIWLGSNCRIK